MIAKIGRYVAQQLTAVVVCGVAPFWLLFVLVSVASSLCLALPAAAQVPSTFNYQGNLRQDGFLVNGKRDMVFYVYDNSVGGVLLSSHPFLSTDPEGDKSVEFSTGVFHVSINLANLNSAQWQSGDLWLEMEVGNPGGARTKLSPREKIAAAPYAVNAVLHSGKKYTTSAVAPPNPAPGDLWLNTNDNSLQYFNAVGWMSSVGGSGGPHAATHSGVGGDRILSLGTHTVTAGAGYAGNMVLLSTGGVDVIRMTGAGEIYANKLYGDGSGITGVGGTDNLGNHIATTTLNMAGEDIAGVSTLIGDSAAPGSYMMVFRSGAGIAAWIRNK